MIVGDPTVLAIESGIMEAYQELTFRALGFFVIHVRGRSFGNNEPDSTMLARSMDEVESRIAKRGTHTAPFSALSDAGRIANAFLNALFADDQEQSYFGIPFSEFCELFHSGSKDCMWAPDGDEAFDDGSFVLQFDLNEHVRVIAFKRAEGHRHDPDTLRDVRLRADDFYRILQQWHDAFDAEWAGLIRGRIRIPGIPGTHD